MKICKLKFHLLKHLNLETALPTYQLPVLVLETKEGVQGSLSCLRCKQQDVWHLFMSCPDLISLFGSNMDIVSQWNLFLSMQQISLILQFAATLLHFECSN
jgi:hypothetical protein